MIIHVIIFLYPHLVKRKDLLWKPMDDINTRDGSLL